MNEETNYRGFWRAVVICCVLCAISFWIPAILISVYYFFEVQL